MSSLYRTAGLVCALVIAGCSSAVTNAGTATQQSIVVSASRAHLEVLLPQDRTWEWYAERTPPNELEYEWAVRIPSGYQIGYKLFKYPGRSPRRGTLEQLVRAGQVDVGQEVMVNGRRVVDRTTIRVDWRVEPDRLIMEVTDSAAVAKIFGARPATVAFQNVIGGRRLRDRQISVTYE